MRYTVGMKPGRSGPSEVKTDSARAAKTYYDAMKRQFGPAFVRDAQGREINDAELYRLASEEAAAER